MRGRRPGPLLVRRAATGSEDRAAPVEGHLERQEVRAVAHMIT